MIIIMINSLNTEEHWPTVLTETLTLSDEQWDAVLRQRPGLAPAAWVRAATEIDLEDCVQTFEDGGDQAREVFPRAD